MRDLAAAGRMADVDRVFEIEFRDQLGDVGRIGVHLIAFVGLARAAVTAAVMCDHPIALAQKNIIWLSQSSALNGQP